MARLLTGAALVAALLISGCANESPSQRPYIDSSIWNDTIAEKGGTVATSNPSASAFGTMFFGGLSSSDQPYAKMAYLANENDPCRSVTLRHTDWNTSDTRIPSDACVPVPAGVQAATGTDGHLTIVSADLHQMWAFWRCKVGSDSGTPCNESNILSGGYQAANGSTWKIHPDDPAQPTGVASCCGSATGRGSGTELLTTVLKTSEAKLGIRHAMGLTLPGDVASSYVYPPAIKSDGDGGTPVKYGSLWALDPNYSCPTATGPKNVCQALKDYGAYIVDRFSVSGSEIDTTGPSEGIANWTDIGVTRNALPIPGSAWRCVDLPNVSGECP